MTAEPRWIATSSLPVDLLAQITRAAGSEIRRHPESKVSGAPWALGPVATLITAFGAFQGASMSEAAGFREPLRWVPLLVGGALLGLALAWSGRRSLKPKRGQGLIVGHASLVIVDDGAVKVIPAERLELKDDVITENGELVDDGFHDGQWKASLVEAITRARSDLGSRATDRWRQYAERATPVDRKTERSAKRKPLLIAAAAGLLLGLFLEAGPLHARSYRAVAARDGAWEGVEKREDGVAAALLSRLDPAPKWTDDRHKKAQEEQQKLADARKKAAEEDQQRRAQAAAELEKSIADKEKNGNINELHALLADEDLSDEQEARIRKALKARCIKQYPDVAQPESVHIRRLILNALCVQGSGNLYWYAALGTERDDAEAVVSKLTGDLSDIAGALGRGIVISPRFGVATAIVRVRVTRIGRPKPMLGGSSEQDVRMSVTVMDGKGNDVATYESEGTMTVRRKRF